MTKPERLLQPADDDFSRGDSGGAAQNRLAGATHDDDYVAAATAQRVAEVVTEDSLDYFSIVKVGKVELLLSATPSGVVQVKPVEDDADRRKTAAQSEFAGPYTKVRVIQASEAGTATLHQGVDQDTHYVTFHGDVVYGPDVALPGTLAVKREDFLSGLRQPSSITTYEPIGDNIPSHAHRRTYSDTVALAIPDNRDPSLLNILIFVNSHQERLAFQFDNDPLAQANAILKKQLDQILDSMPEKKELYKVLFAFLEKYYLKMQKQGLVGSREIGLTKRKLRLLAELEVLGVTSTKTARLLCLARFGFLQSVGTYSERLLAETQAAQIVEPAPEKQPRPTVVSAPQRVEQVSPTSLAPAVLEEHTDTKHKLYAAIAHSWPPFVLKGSATNFAPMAVRKALFELYGLGIEADEIAQTLQTEYQLNVGRAAVETQLRLEAHHLFYKLPQAYQNNFRELDKNLRQLVNEYAGTPVLELGRRIDRIIQSINSIINTDFTANQFRLILFGLVFGHSLSDEQQSKVIKAILQLFLDGDLTTRSQGSLLKFRQANQQDAKMSAEIKRILEAEFDYNPSRPQDRARKLKEIAENAENSQQLTALMRATLSYLDVYEGVLPTSSLSVQRDTLRREITINLNRLTKKGYTLSRLRDYILTTAVVVGWSPETLEGLSPKILPLFIQREKVAVSEERTAEMILDELSQIWNWRNEDFANTTLSNMVSRNLLELLDEHNYTGTEIKNLLELKYSIRIPLVNVLRRIELARRESPKKV